MVITVSTRRQIFTALDKQMSAYLLVAHECVDEFVEFPAHGGLRIQTRLLLKLNITRTPTVTFYERRLQIRINATMI